MMPHKIKSNKVRNNSKNSVKGKGSINNIQIIQVHISKNELTQNNEKLLTLKIHVPKIIHLIHKICLVLRFFGLFEQKGQELFLWTFEVNMKSLSDSKQITDR